MRNCRSSLAWLTLLGLVGCATTLESSIAETPASSEIIAALLAQSSDDIRNQAECDGSGVEGYSADEPWTLGDDIASFLSEMDSGVNKITAECWPPEDGVNTCTVSFGQDKGELVWSRNYRFQMLDGAVTGDLMCFTIP